MISKHCVKQNQELPCNISVSKVCFDSFLKMNNTDVLSLAHENLLFTHDALSLMKLWHLPA